MIQIKRGEKSKLPILNSGEPAFSSDSKEVYIGDGAKNFALPPNHKNMILNSNFQIALNDFDVGSTTITVLPGTSRYLYGNYYIKNLSSSTSNIIITRNFSDGYITINSTNASMVLEYREKLARYTTTGGVITYIQPLKNKDVTLSYDVNNLSTLLSNIQCGFEKSLKTIYIDTGLSRKVIPFTMDYDTTVAYPMMKIVLLSIPNNNSFSFSIGNLKLELGNIATKYSPLPSYLEMVALNKIYVPFSLVVRVIQVTLNTLQFFVPINIPDYFNYDVKLIVKQALLVNINGTTLTDFAITYQYNSTLLGVDVTCTKTAHTILDAYIQLVGFVDLRPT